jgi:hypothetical protein
MKKQICFLIDESLLEVIDSKRKTLGMSRSDIITPVLVDAFFVKALKPAPPRPEPSQPLKKGG